MKRSFSKIYLHYIWSTKNRQKIFTAELVCKINQHIREYAAKNNIFVVEVNGTHDHFHLLIDLPVTFSPARAINLIKGESSHWINEQNFVQGKFFWQKRYSIFSVSESQKEKVKKYIQTQEKHHQKISFQEEVKEFLKKHGLAFSEDLLV